MSSASKESSAPPFQAARWVDRSPGLEHPGRVLAIPLGQRAFWRETDPVKVALRVNVWFAGIRSSATKFLGGSRAFWRPLPQLEKGVHFPFFLAGPHP